MLTTAFVDEPTPAQASILNNCESVNPAAPNAPHRNHSRRVGGEFENVRRGVGMVTRGTGELGSHLTTLQPTVTDA